MYYKKDLPTLINKEINELDFEKIYKKNYKFVYQRTYHILKNKQDAEEITADVFIKLWENIPTLDMPMIDLKSWLYRVLTNASIDSLRKNKRNKEINLEMEYFNSITCIDPYIENNPINKEYQNILEEALLKMANRKHRIAYILLNLEGYNTKQISYILKQKQATVKIWIYRGKQELKRILELNQKSKELR